MLSKNSFISYGMRKNLIKISSLFTIKILDIFKLGYLSMMFLNNLEFLEKNLQKFYIYYFFNTLKIILLNDLINHYQLMIFFIIIN